jgi:hypothetical protein
VICSVAMGPIWHADPVNGGRSYRPGPADSGPQPVIQPMVVTIIPDSGPGYPVNGGHSNYCLGLRPLLKLLLSSGQLGSWTVQQINKKNLAKE